MTFLFQVRARMFLGSSVDVWVTTLARLASAVLSFRRAWKAPVQIIVCTSEQVYRERDKKPETEAEIERPILHWHTDAGCSPMLMLLAAVNEGLESAFVGAPDSKGLQQLLDIPDEFLSIGVLSPSLKRGGAWSTMSCIWTAGRHAMVLGLAQRSTAEQLRIWPDSRQG